MNGKVVRRLLVVVIGIAALAIVAVVAYNHGINVGQGGGQPMFGPMRGYGRLVGFDAGYGLWGLLSLLLLGFLFVGLFVILVAPSGRAAPTPQQPTPSVGADGLRELSEMHSRGELTDEEFTAAKRRLLGL